jgi:DNA-binding response OmpR family regulator
MCSEPTVVLAEDDLLLALILKTFIQSKNLHLIAEFTTEEDVVGFCRKEQPDFIILDIHLQEGNGLKAYSRIRAFSDVPILMISGSTSSSIPDLKGLDYIVKPFMVEDFSTKIDRMLAKHQQHANS